MDREKNSVAYPTGWRPHSIHLHHWVHTTVVRHGGGCTLNCLKATTKNGTVLSRETVPVSGVNALWDKLDELVGTWKVPYSTNTILLTRQKEV
jgi:hypothetical protein